jgi:hypothetical protein
MPRAALIDTVRDVMREWYVEGSDPGLAVASEVSAEMTTFAARSRNDVVTQGEARRVAERAGCHLEGLGGTNQGIIGALSAIALVAGGEHGRVLHMQSWPWPDPFVGVQPVNAIRQRGVAAIETMAGRPFIGERIDVGKHLRPNWRGGRVVLFVDQPTPTEPVWRACKLD